MQSLQAVRSQLSTFFKEMASEDRIRRDFSAAASRIADYTKLFFQSLLAFPVALSGRSCCPQWAAFTVHRICFGSIENHAHD